MCMPFHTLCKWVLSCMILSECHWRNPDRRLVDTERSELSTKCMSKSLMAGRPHAGVSICYSSADKVSAFA